MTSLIKIKNHRKIQKRILLRILIERKMILLSELGQKKILQE